MAVTSNRAFVLGTVAVLALAGCVEGNNPFDGRPGTDAADASDAKPVAQARSVKLVDRDVEAPEVFQVTDAALWDGRPSLGGVWVASPDAVDPERVILRNPGNGKFVIGALFRRERDNPGPKLQISSDAAAALGLLAGEPGQINVTALRREEVPLDAPDANRPILDESETIEAQPIEAIAVAAIDKAESAPAIPDAPAAATAAPETPKAKPEAKPAATPAASGGLIQIGIFSVEANASRAVDTLAKAGITASVRKEESQGKTFWSVTARGDSAALAQIKAAGFADAYPLKRG